ncbi:unnamed protein product [Protopolystoma xenopodis]|uniref:Uncharacterized protein n=1 Tax=Protopolystoma xenopodis TaxID=117903 RepID=A0A448X5Y6_9PLAT|nr:unnamed protein product [Protopolystoma xenopodis]
MSGDDGPQTPATAAVASASMSASASAAATSASSAALPKVYSYMEQALCQAAAEGRLNTMMRILHERIDINCLDAVGYTPLHYAAMFGQLEAIKLLLCNRAQVNAINWCGTSPLHLAAHNNHLRCAQLLVFSGASTGLVCTASGCRACDLAPINSPVRHFLERCDDGEPVSLKELFNWPAQPLVPEHAIPPREEAQKEKTRREPPQKGKIKK